MKILLTSPINHPENHQLSEFILDFASFARKENSVKIITLGKNTKQGKTNNSAEDPNLIIINKRRNFLVRNLEFIYAIFKNRDCDFIFCQGAVAAGLPSLIAAKLFRIPLIVNFPSDEVYERYLFIEKNNLSLEDFYKQTDLSNYLRVLTRIQTFVLKRADKIITPNNYFKKLIIEKYKLDETEIKTIYPFLRNEIVLPFAPQKENFTIMTYASLHKNATTKIKNIIDTVVELQKSFNPIVLHIFGDGNGREHLQNLVLSKNAGEFIKFHGRVSDAELLHYKKISTIFISSSPSVRNVFHILENFKIQTITLARENSLAKEYLVNKETGIFYDSENKESLKDAIKEIFTDSNLRANINKNALLELDYKYSLRNYFLKLQELIH